MIKNLIKKIFKKFGYVSKFSLPNQKNKFDSLYVLLFALQKKNYKIIQIGANDGVTGDDPINSFIMDHHNSISYIGFEPQSIPFGKLKKNYRGINNFYFIKECIGEEGKNKFYYWNEKYHELCKKNNWEFSDGINSLLEENLSRRLLKNNLNPIDYIDNYEVDVLPLKKSIEKNIQGLSEDFRNIDLLQIDAEGYDDKVIYNSSLDFFKPKYINFEYKNLSKTNLENLIKFLKQNSYECIKWKTSDCLAVLTNSSENI